jgi:hypothetical protein
MGHGPLIKRIQQFQKTIDTDPHTIELTRSDELEAALAHHVKTYPHSTRFLPASFAL